MLGKKKQVFAVGSNQIMFSRCCPQPCARTSGCVVGVRWIRLGGLVAVRVGVDFLEKMTNKLGSIE